MLESLKNADKNLFLYLNGMHNSFFDALMPYLTTFWVWIPLFAWWFYLVYKCYGQKTIAIVIFTVILILASDQGSGLIKKSVKRYRPTYHTEIGQKVHIVDNYRGGQFGFISSHAANSFAIAVFVFFLMRPSGKILAISLFLWAFITSYSRIYLGVHYPLDIIGGALLGSGLGFIFYRIFNRFFA